MLDSDTTVLIFYSIFAVLALWAFIQAWVHQSRTETIHPFKAFIYSVIYEILVKKIVFILLIFFFCGALTL